jgi:hypothetical protein
MDKAVLSVLFPRTTTGANDNPNCAWYFKNRCSFFIKNFVMKLFKGLPKDYLEQRDK